MFDDSQVNAPEGNVLGPANRLPVASGSSLWWIGSGDGPNERATSGAVLRGRSLEAEIWRTCVTRCCGQLFAVCRSWVARRRRTRNAEEGK